MKKDDLKYWLRLKGFKPSDFGTGEKHNPFKRKDIKKQLQP